MDPRSGQPFKVGTVAKSGFEDIVSNSGEGTPLKYLWDEVISPNYEEVMKSCVQGGLEKVARDEHYVFLGSIFDARHHQVGNHFALTYYSCLLRWTISHFRDTPAAFARWARLSRPGTSAWACPRAAR